MIPMRILVRLVPNCKYEMISVPLYQQLAVPRGCQRSLLETARQANSFVLRQRVPDKRNRCNVTAKTVSLFFVFL